MASYEPGVCNIGAEHRRQRFLAGVASFVAAAVYTGWLVTAGKPPLYLLGTFVLLTGGFLGYLQGRMQFCVAFAAMAQYDLSGTADESGAVSEAELRRKDRRRAFEITAYAMALGLAGTLLAYILLVVGTA